MVVGEDEETLRIVAHANGHAAGQDLRDFGETTTLLLSSDIPLLDSDFSKPRNFWSKSSSLVSALEN